MERSGRMSDCPAFAYYVTIPLFNLQLDVFVAKGEGSQPTCYWASGQCDWQIQQSFLVTIELHLPSVNY